jgi:hypothetical protein
MAPIIEYLWRPMQQAFDPHDGKSVFPIVMLREQGHGMENSLQGAGHVYLQGQPGQWDICNARNQVFVVRHPTRLLVLCDQIHDQSGDAVFLVWFLKNADARMFAQSGNFGGRGNDQPAVHGPYLDLIVGYQAGIAPGYCGPVQERARKAGFAAARRPTQEQSSWAKHDARAMNLACSVFRLGQGDNAGQFKRPSAGFFPQRR